MILIRLLMLPIVLVFLMCAAIGNALAWLFDSTYDHRAAASATSMLTGWINSDAFFPARKQREPKP